MRPFYNLKRKGKRTSAVTNIDSRAFEIFEKRTDSNRCDMSDACKQMFIKLPHHRLTLGFLLFLRLLT